MEIPMTETNPTTADMLRGCPVSRRLTRPPNTAQMGATMSEEHISHVSIEDIEEDEDEENGEGDGDVKSRKGLFHLIEYAAPLQVISFRDFDLGDLLLGLLHSSAQILGSHAEFDGDISLVVFPVDE